MKKEHATKCRHFINMGLNHDLTPMSPETCTCDGYHTFDELYNHRITLYITLCKALYHFNSGLKVWRSKYHSDGSLCFGTGTQFVMGIGWEKGKQITYHIPIERWSETEFARELAIAPEYDGHSSDDVIERLKLL